LNLPDHTPATPAATPGPEGGAVATAQLELADLFGDIAEFWGFTRTQGRIFGLVLACREPIGQREIRERLDISAGSASMTLGNLLRWDVLHRTDVGYTAQTDLWKLITGVMRRRERGVVEACIARTRATLAALHAVRDANPDRLFLVQRLERLLEFFTLGREFLDAFVQRSRLHGLLDHLARRAAKLPFPRIARAHDVGIRA
jgi:DNA-binding transcriptional regulator GbsR (MarR family)